MCCSSEALDIIREKVTEFIGENRLFTAYDVSRAVQAELKARSLPFERHRDMKGEIHPEITPHIASGQYVQKLHDVGAPSNAYLYYPLNADPNSYVPQDRKDAPKQVDSTSQVPAQTQDDVVGTATKPFASQDDDDTSAATLIQPIFKATMNGQDALVGGGDSDDSDEGDEIDSGRKPDARGTVCVPNHVLRAAGFGHKDVAYVVTRRSDLVLVRRLGVNDQKLATYTVDYSDNVRITAKTLEKAGLVNSPKGYDFKRDGDQVVVSVHD